MEHNRNNDMNTEGIPIIVIYKEGKEMIIQTPFILRHIIIGFIQCTKEVLV